MTGTERGGGGKGGSVNPLKMVGGGGKQKRAPDNPPGKESFERKRTALNENSRKNRTHKADGNSHQKRQTKWGREDVPGKTITKKEKISSVGTNSGGGKQRPNRDFFKKRMGGGKNNVRKGKRGKKLARAVRTDKPPNQRDLLSVGGKKHQH